MRSPFPCTYSASPFMDGKRAFGLIEPSAFRSAPIRVLSFVSPGRFCQKSSMLT